MSAMSDAPFIRARNDDLAQRLQAFPQQFRDFLRKGVFSPDARGRHVPALGFHLVTTEELSRAFILTPGRFVMAEMLPTGDALAVTIPLHRILRVDDRTVQGVTSCLVEYEGDMHTVRDLDLVTHRHAYSTYRIDARTPEEAASLLEFSMTLRVLLDTLV